MPPWLSSGTLRCVIALTLGWMVLAAVLASASGAFPVGRALIPSDLTLSQAVRFDRNDPCTNGPLQLDGRIVAHATAIADDLVIHVRGTVVFNGTRRLGDAEALHQIGDEERFDVDRPIVMGQLEAIDVRVPIVEPPNRPVTSLMVRLQTTWNGSDASHAITDLALACV